ncbi:hypothetical protein [Methylobacterium nigriterrae]|uniref:hypothetical protein n=1 Tax=Methylobacterium nigriterrae TaxID=3127512 RepID=UPI00301383BF
MISEAPCHHVLELAALGTPSGSLAIAAKAKAPDQICDQASPPARRRAAGALLIEPWRFAAHAIQRSLTYANSAVRDFSALADLSFVTDGAARSHLGWPRLIDHGMRRERDGGMRRQKRRHFGHGLRQSGSIDASLRRIDPSSRRNRRDFAYHGLGRSLLPPKVARVQNARSGNEP